ncbi:2-amino-4-hydroxy-6-hydroxymethyldihydropteridine diphosphokinase [Wenzhouxiangella sp. XN79A]|uniref:2-amino-4-hydroxy-6- hydroxymethyldihydropteridine diphosphokinase n=1 Tax=Wenzhouxiangella sp. XN79A TaxID=2724193 RepID=UPI00144ADB77|nr:2-amino-4-hydroxy-6-hydroxymethyldihydropteridine diphosphokinase [Wenzhouxiangella sp. XN79A]NKI35456.1 2-amino-4-hydroxy-6-hydroxymethyldihydropteridine diphosphokinase [Wenzhouxiangella sp. XN79A]
MSTRTFIGIGSNLGDPERQVRAAIDSLAGLPSTVFDRSSGLYRTAPWGDLHQPDFVNAVVELQTGLSAPALLAELKRLEDEAGRVRDAARRWGPRRLDLDLLWFGGEAIELDDLVVPHPRMHERAFVLQPLCELEPMLELPGRGRVDVLLAGLAIDGIQRVSEGAPATAVPPA